MERVRAAQRIKPGEPVPLIGGLVDAAVLCCRACNRLDSSCSLSRQRRPLFVGPALEFRRVVQVEAVEKWTGVEHSRASPVFRGDGFPEFFDIRG